jgi:hypothetical protein
MSSRVPCEAVPAREDDHVHLAEMPRVGIHPFRGIGMTVEHVRFGPYNKQ